MRKFWKVNNMKMVIFICSVIISKLAKLKRPSEWCFGLMFFSPTVKGLHYFNYKVNMYHYCSNFHYVKFQYPDDNCPQFHRQFHPHFHRQWCQLFINKFIAVIFPFPKVYETESQPVSACSGRMSLHLLSSFSIDLLMLIYLFIRH